MNAPTPPQGPDPRSIAYVLAEAVKPRVIAAQRYLDDWRAGSVAGIPLDDLRHALDRSPVKTQPMEALRGWNQKGLIALTGALNSGKSFAAAHWALALLRRGRSVVWVSSAAMMSWTDVTVELGRAARAHAFIFDDGGVGTLAQHAAFGEKLHATLVARGQRPAIVTSNANEANMELALGPRVMSRLRQAGRIVHIEREAELREPDLERLDEDTYTGVRWRAARDLVAIFGCEPDDKTDANLRVVRGHLVGDKLASGLARRGAEAEQVGWLMLLAQRYGCEWTELLEQARQRDLVLSGLHDQVLEAVGSMVTEAKAATMRAIVAPKPGRALSPIPRAVLGGAPKWAKGNGSKDKLKRLGFSVTARGVGWVVKRSLGPKSAPIVMSDDVATEPLAWEFAARLCGEPVEAQP